MIAAIAELSRAIIRVGAPAAVNAIMNVISDPTHKDHVRACDIVLSSADPVETRHQMEVVHRTVDPDQEALEELRALRQLRHAAGDLDRAVRPQRPRSDRGTRSGRHREARRQRQGDRRRGH